MNDDVVKEEEPGAPGAEAAPNEPKQEFEAVSGSRDDSRIDQSKESLYLRDVAVPHVSDVKDPSPVSLHLLVKNGAGVVGRLMDNIGPYITEVVAVLNDCTDDTEAILAAACAARNIAFVPIAVTKDTHPDWYILDTKATYEVGRSLSGEEFGGPFTENPILADWSSARNLGWRACTEKWRLFLDADDVVKDPETLPGLVKVLEEQKVEVCATAYEYAVNSQGEAIGLSFRERLAVNKPAIRWVQPIHEVLHGTMRIAHVRGNFVVRDMRDNKGAGVRIPGRNFKILYHRARSRDWEVSPRLLADIVMEVRHMAHEPSMMEFAEALLAKYLEEATWPEERGFIHAMVGEMHESREELDRAIYLYEESLAIHPGSKTAFRLCRTHFKRGCEKKELFEQQKISKADLDAEWEAVIAAHQLGVDNKAAHQVLDDGPIYEEMEKIHVAGALVELGRVTEAVKFTNEAIAAFPQVSALHVMASELAKMEVDAAVQEVNDAAASLADEALISIAQKV